MKNLLLILLVSLSFTACAATTCTKCSHKKSCSSQSAECECSACKEGKACTCGK